jgi:hypothetical protein
MSHIVQHCPDQALNKFEEISYAMKHKESIKIEDFLETGVSRDYSKPSDTFKRD